MEFTIEQLAKITDSKVYNCDNKEVIVTGLNTIDKANNNEISFLHNDKYFNQISTTKAYCVIVPENFETTTKVILLKNKNPYKAFQQLVLSFFPPQRLVEKGVSKFADIDSSAKLGANSGVGSFSYIGENCRIGKNVQIAQNVTIYQGVIVGDDSIIHSGCTIRENCIVGNNVILQNGCIIGSDGFGFSPSGANYDKIPQVGNVILEDRVEIGANTVIDRATLGSTVVGEGTKLDNLIQIAHNVEIGKNNVIAAQTGISGSTTIGNHCMIGGQCGFAGHIKVGDQCGIGAKSGITKSIKLGSIVTGNPVRDLRKQRKIDASLTRLPDLIYKFKDFEKQLKSLVKKGL